MTPATPAVSRRCSGALRAAVAWVLFAPLPLLLGAAPPAKQYDIPAGTADRSLKQFSEQAGLEVIFSTRVARSAKTNPVKGEMRARQALDALLLGTGLVIIQDQKTGAFTVSRNAPQAPTVPPPTDSNEHNSKKKVTETPQNQEPMKRSNLLTRLAGALALLVAPAAPAQTVPAAASSPAASDNDPIVLSPFEVASDRDTGYRATSTLAGTRLRSDLKDVAASISVVTRDFMEDIAANNLEDLLPYTLGTEVAGAGGNFSDAISTGSAEGLTYNSALDPLGPGTRVRGLTRADSTREFFGSSIPVDGYNIERTEISRGPNSMLFGLGSPSGIINTSLIRASLREDRTKLKHQMGSYGTSRYEIDHDETLINDKLGVRVASMYDKTYYRTRPAYVEKKALYLTSTYRPFRSTTIRLSGEIGEQESNRPQYRPPYDSTGHWWDVGRPSYNPATNAFTMLGTVSTVDPRVTPNGTIALTSSVMGWAGNSNFGLFYSDPNSSELGIPGTGAQAMKTLSQRVYRNAANTGWVAQSGMQMLNNANHYYDRLAAGTPSHSYWKMPSITDPAIYDFFHYQLEGPNKNEWAEWNAFNVAVEQRFFQNRAGIELVYDWQDLNHGAQRSLAAVDYNIRLDINSHLTNGAPNPNYLRPFIGGYSNSTRGAETADAGRATAYYDLDLTKKGPGWLGRFLGRHMLTGAFTSQRSFEEGLNGPAFTSAPEYWLTDTGNSPPVATVGNNRRLTPQVRYIGPSVATLAGPAALRVQPLAASQWDTDLQSVKVLYHLPPAATATTPNPYTVREFGILSNAYKAMDYVTAGSRRETRIDSLVFINQARWLDNHVVGTIGWRRDAVEIADASTVPLDPNTGAGLTDGVNYPMNVDPAAGITDTSFNWGAVVRAPRRWMERVPFGTELSISFNSADNFRVAGQRQNLYGEFVGPERGQAREWGVRISTFNGRFELRSTHYKNDTLRNATPELTSSIARLTDMVNNVLESNLSGRNDATPQLQAGKAVWEAWERSPEGVRFKELFRFELFPPSNWVHDRRQNQVVGTSDIVAEGWEHEVIFNPTRNWRISFNVARQQAVLDNIGQEYVDVLEDFKRIADGPGGDALSDANIFRSRFRDQTLDGANAVLLRAGSPTPELRKWRWNLVTNYSFTEGFLRGFGLGGATRMQDRGVIGFPYYAHPELGVVPDVANPYFADEEQNFDVWISYRRKISNRITWKAQLNIKNIGVGNKLIPIGAQPDGTIHSWRIAEPQRWTLTNTFSF